MVDNHALKAVLERGHLGAVVLDVWENEPEPDLDLLRYVTLATPHIAGYSFDGKIRGTVMIYKAVIHHFGLKVQWDYSRLLKPDSTEALKGANVKLPDWVWLRGLVDKVYDLEADHLRMRRVLDLAPAARGYYFKQLRKQHPRRRAFESYSVRDVPNSLCQTVAEGLRMRIAKGLIHVD